MEAATKAIDLLSQRIDELTKHRSELVIKRQEANRAASAQVTFSFNPKTRASTHQSMKSPLLV